MKRDKPPTLSRWLSRFHSFSFPLTTISKFSSSFHLIKFLAANVIFTQLKLSLTLLCISFSHVYFHDTQTQTLLSSCCWCCLYFSFWKSFLSLSHFSSSCITSRRTVAVSFMCWFWFISYFRIQKNYFLRVFELHYVYRVGQHTRKWYKKDEWHNFFPSTLVNFDDIWEFLCIIECSIICILKIEEIMMIFYRRE